MGSQAHKKWPDMSDYVVHFTKPPKRRDPIPDPPPPASPGRLTVAELALRIRAGQDRDTTGYPQIMSILFDGELQPGASPLGAARRMAELGDSQRSVCFSEIPLDMLDRLVERRSRYGIGFRKDLLVSRGGTPLWYVDDESPQATVVRDIIQAKRADGIDPGDPFWKLTPFIDHPGVYNGRTYRFEWEREWRVSGSLRFTPDEVEFLFIPEDLHDKARQFFADVKFEHSGPAYECPFIDPSWSIEQINEALTAEPAAPEPSPSAVPHWVDPVDWDW